MASGMGMASMGIYSYELYNAYGVENILRIGTAGAICKDLPVKSLVFGMGACTNSNYAMQYNLPGTYAPIASYELLKKGVELAEKRTDVNYKVGNLFSSDTFYDEAESGLDWAKMGVLAIEMEAAALYMNAARAGKNAMALCTISDNIVTGEAATAEERQTTFTTMMEIALDLAVEMD
jgi:purine-nucleoside phosphorylase